MFKLLGAAAMALLSLAGCQYISGLTLKTCDAPETLASMESMLIAAVKSSTGRDVSHEDFVRLVRFDLLHPVKLEENIGKYSCEGKVHIGPEGGEQLELNLAYSSQMVNDQHYVEMANGKGLALLLAQALESPAASSPAQDAAAMARDALKPAEPSSEPAAPAVAQVAEGASSVSPEGHIEACAAAREADGKPYAEAKAILLKSDYWPSRPEDVKENFPMDIDGDPASCGNRGCQIAWEVYKGARELEVGVTVDDNKDTTEWITHVTVSDCN